MELWDIWAELRKTEEYKNMRYNYDFIYCYDAEKFFGRELTEAEELAIADNREDQVLVDMGR